MYLYAQIYKIIGNPDNVVKKNFAFKMNRENCTVTFDKNQQEKGKIEWNQSVYEFDLHRDWVSIYNACDIGKKIIEHYFRAVSFDEAPTLRLCRFNKSGLWRERISPNITDYYVEEEGLKLLYVTKDNKELEIFLEDNGKITISNLHGLTNKQMIMSDIIPIVTEN